LGSLLECGDGRAGEGRGNARQADGQADQPERQVVEDAQRQTQALAASLRARPQPVIGRITDGRLWLDLRCLEDETRFLEMLLK